MNTDSTSTRTSTPVLEKPSVFNTASSLVRSRTACAMVLATTSRIVKISAGGTARPIAPSSGQPTAVPMTEMTSGRTSHRYRDGRSCARCGVGSSSSYRSSSSSVTCCSR